MMGWFDRALDVLYPRVCALCESAAEEGMCGSCAAQVAWIGSDACPACGAARPGEWCSACSGREFRFRRAVALGPYDGVLRAAVLALKFHGQRTLALPLGRRIADRVRSAGMPVDVVTFVPMSRWKMLRRRYNPAELLAESVARDLRLPLRAALRKSRSTRAQADLALEARLENPRGAYRARGRSDDRAVLLVDDVLTTGATASACADALYAAGAREVSLAVVARS